MHVIHFNGILPILGFKRKTLTKGQKRILMEQFQAKRYLSKQESRKLAMLLNMKESTIANWYRMMRRKKAAEGMLSLGK